jgi:hypothetical protein
MPNACYPQGPSWTEASASRRLNIRIDLDEKTDAQNLERVACAPMRSSGSPVPDAARPVEGIHDGAIV